METPFWQVIDPFRTGHPRFVTGIGPRFLKPEEEQLGVAKLNARIRDFGHRHPETGANCVRGKKTDLQ
jgi:hypothetical protein